MSMMKFTYYGTAASEGLPAVYCKCSVCQEAARRGGRNLRTRSQALVNGVLLIDFPADTYAHMLYGGLPLPQLSHCLITHAHGDHLYGEELENFQNGFCHRDTPMTFYGSGPSGELILQYGNNENIRFQKVEPFVPFEAADHLVTPLPACHAPNLDPLMYLIEKNGETLLYAHDTGIFEEPVWEFLKGKKLDLVSLDCTHANTDKIGYNFHMTLNMNCQVRDRLREMNCADEKTVFYTNHFSHNGGDVLYEEFCSIACERGFGVSYDGCTVQIENRG